MSSPPPGMLRLSDGVDREAPRFSDFVALIMAMQRGDARINSERGIEVRMEPLKERWMRIQVLDGWLPTFGSEVVGMLDATQAAWRKSR